MRFRRLVHERAKRQALKAGIGFTELSNGFASCDDPAGLQEICDRLQPGTIEVFAQRWLHRLPNAGYWRECSMRQVEVSRTIVFDEPCRVRSFFEALIADSLDIGRPGPPRRPAHHRPAHRRLHQLRPTRKAA
jgi:hypothetical protein